MTIQGPTQTWDPGRYRVKAAYVVRLGEALLDFFKPRAGERVLDLGCGDGVLTEKIAAAGASVVGVDASPEMVAAAKARGIDARRADARALGFERDFDAVFSNAVLHWIREPDAVIASVARVLRPGGRFVGELGGHGNVAAVVVALVAALNRRGRDGVGAIPWYFPTPEEYRERLEGGGFAVEYIKSFPRPTRLESGMADWLDLFAGAFFARLPEDERAAARTEVLELLRPALCDGFGRWTADIVRLRFAARAARG